MQMFGQWEGDKTILCERLTRFSQAHLLTNTALGLHGSYGGDRKDILTFEDGLKFVVFYSETILH